jgi:DNA-binding XRE family transcriptional regulator
MQRHRLNRTELVSESQKERDRAIREKFAGKPSLADLQSSGEYYPTVKHGEYLALMHFAETLKRFRKMQQLSLSDLANRSGIDKSAISRLENGQADNPTIATLERLARSMGKRIKIELEDDCPVG